MSFLEQWKKQLRLNLLQVKWWFAERIERDVPDTVYTTLAGMSLWPLVEVATTAALTGQPVPFTVWTTLGTITASVGSNLVAEQIQRWVDSKQKVTELDVIDWVRINASQNAQLRGQLDAIIQQLEGTQLAIEEADTEQQQHFLRHLEQEARNINSTLTPMLVEMRRTATATELVSAVVTAQYERRDAIEHYLKTLVEECDPIDIASIDEDYATGREASVRLSDVFTTLHLTNAGQLLTRSPDETVNDALEAYLQPRRDETREMKRQVAETLFHHRAERQQDDEHIPISAIDGIADRPRLVILGAPGGGKSSLVNHLTAELAKRKLGESDTLSAWEQADLTPVKIVLRRFAAWLPSKLPQRKAGLVWDYLRHQMASKGCEDGFAVLKRTLRKSGGIIFFDGLDEVRESDAENKRTMIKEAILAFSRPLTHCRVVVTCREYAYKHGDAWQLPANDFPQFELAYFALKQMREFATTWYRTIAPQKGWDSAKAEREAIKLIAALEQQKHLFELAQYPLLLTLMTQIHGRDGTLPEDRAHLYERAVNLLLSHWESRIDRDYDEQIKSGLITQLGVRRDDLKSALARVALQAHEQQEQDPNRDERAADIRKAELREVLGNKLGSFDKAELVMIYVQERAGLLQARNNATYTFPHRTFQEYLAALSLWERADPAKLLRRYVHRDTDWWREVFLLAAGMKNDTPSAVASLIDTLLPRDHTLLSTDIVNWSLLAEQAIAETRFDRYVAQEHQEKLSSGRFQAVHNKVANWLTKAISAEAAVTPAERARAGDALGRLGDTRKGVSVTVLADGTKLPDIAWGKEVPADDYTIGGDKRAYSSFDKMIVPIATPYRLARYPITVAQFQCFVGVDDVDDDRWWAGMPEVDKDWQGREYPVREIIDSNWTIANRPRETVSWYQAIAFCRWLSDKLDFDVDLPTEAEWEVAARYSDGRVYPWGNEWDSKKLNADGDIGQTTAVGIYPSGANPTLELFDMSGNVWEWCRNKYNDLTATQVDASGDTRTLHAGSWNDDSYDCRSAYRSASHPLGRRDRLGFRLVVRGRPSQDR